MNEAQIKACFERRKFIHSVVVISQLPTKTETEKERLVSELLHQYIAGLKQ